MKRHTVIVVAGGLLVVAIGSTWLLNDDAPVLANDGVPADSLSVSDLKTTGRGSSRRSSPLHRPRLGEDGEKQLRGDPAAYLSARSGGGGALWGATAGNLLVAWAAEDPGAAMEWVDRGGHSVVRAQLLGAVAAGILCRDGVTAMLGFLERHQQDPRLLPKHQGELENHAFFYFGREDTIAAALKILKAPDHADRAAGLAGWMVLGVDGAQRQVAAIDYLQAKGIPVAVDYWPFQTSIAEEPRYWADWAEQRDSDLLEQIVRAWFRKEPDEARGWIESRFAEDAPGRRVLEAVLEQ